MADRIKEATMRIIELVNNEHQLVEDYYRYPIDWTGPERTEARRRLMGADVVLRERIYHILKELEKQ